ncbi:MAG: HEAT repeat domain-containing protein [Planctomycetota bacterium]
MPSLEQRLCLLRSEPRPRVASILAAALPHAEASERAALCRTIVATGDPAGLAAVLEVSHRLDPGARQWLAKADVAFQKPLQVVLASRRRRSTLNAIDLIECRADPTLLWHLVPLLRSRWDEVAQGAATALLGAAVTLVGPNGRRRRPLALLRELDAVVARAAASYHEHRHDDVLLAAAVLAVRPGPRLAELLADPHHPVVFALRGVVDRRFDHALVRSNLLSWLTVDSLGGQAARWLHRISAGERPYADLLRRGYLLVVPARRRALRRADRPMRCLPDLAEAAGLPAPAQAHLPRFTASLGITRSQQIRRLAEMIALPSPVARLKALSCLFEYGSAEARAAVERFCFDLTAAVAGMAVQHVLGRGGTGDAALLAKLERSPHPAIARRARVALAQSGVGPYFERWGQLDVSARIAAAHSVAATDRRGMIERLQVRLVEGGARCETLSAIQLGRRLGLEASLEEALMGHARSADPYVASAAIAALVDGRSSERLAVLQSGLGHPDARVRANAVEAMMRAAGSQAIEIIEPLTASEENRTRANAVRAVLKQQPGSGLDELRAMLTDTNPLHRVSGIWVARCARAVPAVSMLEAVARNDRIAQVRVRAGAALRLLGSPFAAIGREQEVALA